MELLDKVIEAAQAKATTDEERRAFADKATNARADFAKDRANIATVNARYPDAAPAAETVAEVRKMQPKALSEYLAQCAAA